MNYENWSREDLIDELKRLRRLLENDGKLRDKPAEEIRIDTNLNEAWYADSQLVQTIFSRILEFVYYAELENNQLRQIRFASPHIEHIYGITREEYLNNTSALINNIHPEDLAAIRDATSALYKSKQPQTFTYRFFHKKKEAYVWLEETVYPKLNDEGKIYGNLGVIRDVTEKVEAEIKLRRSQTSLENVLNAINQVVYHFDFSAQGNPKVLYLSQNIEELLGVDYEEYQNDPLKFGQYCHPDDLQGVMNMLREQRIDHQPKVYRYRFLHQKKKEYFWLEEYVVKTFDADNNVLTAFGITRNITEQKEAEDRLRTSEERFRMLAQNADDIIFRMALYPEPHYEYISPSLEIITGYSPEEFYKNPLAGYNLIHPDDKGPFESSMKVIAGQKPAPTSGEQEKSFVVRWIRKDGNVIWTETRNKRILDETGKVIAVEGISRDVTAQKEAEDRLRTSEERFRMLAQNAEDIIFRMALYPEPHYEYISPAVTRMTGYDPDVFYNDPRTAFDLIHPDDRAPFRKVQEEGRQKLALQTDELEERSYILRWVCKDGRVIWTETRDKHITDNSGKIIAVEGITRDITRKKQAEEEIIASREFYRTLIEQSPDGIIFLDLSGKLLSANPAAYKIIGAENEEKLLRQNVFNYVLPEYHEQEKGRLKEVMDGGHVPFNTVQVKTAKGEIVEVESKPILYQYQGKPAIIAFVRDLSVFRTLEKEQLRVQVMEESNQKLQIEIQDRIRAERQLSETQKNLRLLIDSSLDTISSADRDGHITEFNAAAERTFGYTREEALGSHLSILLGGNQEQAMLISSKLEADGYYAGEVINKRKNGELFTSLLAASVLRNEDGEVIGSMGVSRDITERKTFERQLVETQKYLRLLIDSSIDMIIASDKDGNITEFNASAERSFGYTREEALKMNINKLYKNDDEGRRISRKLIEENSFFSGEIINKRKNGEEFYCFLSASILRNEDGQIVGSMGISRDISDRLQAERELRLREEKYRAVFNQAYTGIALVSVQKGRYIEVNERLCSMLGYSRNELLEMSVNELQLPGDLSRLPKGEDFIKLGFRHIVDEHRYRHKNGDTVFVNITITLVRGDDNQPLHFVYVYEDLTPKRKAEEKLRIQASKLNAVIESSSHIIWTIDRNSLLTSFNKNYAYWFGKSYSYQPYIGLDMIAYSKKISEEYAIFWNDKVQKTFAGNAQHFELPLTMKDGSVAWREVFLNPIHGPGDEIIEVSCIAHEITEMKRAQEKIHRQAEQLNAIIESSTHMIWAADRHHRMTSFNKQQSDWIERAYGIKPFVGMEIDDVKKRTGKVYADFWDEKFAATFAGKPQYFESKFEHANGEVTWREVYLNPIRNEKGEIIELSCIAHDITEKKAIDENLRQSLKEKEVLLKEVHHRVKNNLQVISSILNLQKAYVRDQKTLDLLHESQNRIKSMAFVHESLYQTKDFSNINFADYIGNVTRNLMHSYASTESPPELELNLAPIQLNLDTAIPCGLIINELLSNALKYAFRKTKNGKISLTLTENKGNIKIVIADNGSGLPETVDYRNTESLGLQLVVTLVEQINGKIKLENKKGAKFTIEFTSIPANQ